MQNRRRSLEDEDNQSAIVSPQIAGQDEAARTSRHNVKTILSENMKYLLHLDNSHFTSMTPPNGVRSNLLITANLASDDLDNPIHPLFSIQRWANVTSERYELLSSSLRLASNLLTEESLLPWWVHTLYGVPTRSAMGHTYLEKSAEEDCSGASPAVLDHFVGLSTLVTFRFEHLVHGECNDHTIKAHALASDNEVPSVLDGTWTSYSNFNNPCVLLNTQLLRNIEVLHASSHKHTAGHLEAAALDLACTLIHEIAHIFYMYRQFKSSAPIESVEPAHHMNEEQFARRCKDGSTRLMSDLGHSWQNWAFGATTCTVSFPMDAPLSLLTFYHPTILEPDRDSGKVLATRDLLTRIPVPSWWTHLWFRRSVWKEYAELRRKGCLVLPTREETGFHFHLYNYGGNEGWRWTLWFRGWCLDTACNMDECTCEDITDI